MGGIWSEAVEAAPYLRRNIEPFPPVLKVSEGDLASYHTLMIMNDPCPPPVLKVSEGGLVLFTALMMI